MPIPRHYRQAQMAESDRDVLLAIYRATGGDQWNQNNGWCTDDGISRWFGVKARDEQVVELKLPENNVQGTSNGIQHHTLFGNISSVDTFK